MSGMFYDLEDYREMKIVDTAIVPFERKEVVEVLEKYTALVKFKKLNGDMRSMECTLVKDMIPPATKEDTMSQKKVRNLNEEVLAVWDVEKEGWRSFRLENIVSIEYEVEEIL